jgi:hypothetical protein
VVKSNFLFLVSAIFGSFYWFYLPLVHHGELRIP